ncbi:MAG: cytochrome c [Mesorhizobium sp.]|nr:cytochrome c [Mesorhizobium sp.]MCO5164349.1 cytochrome c [Mesorhizobium sp.]
MTKALHLGLAFGVLLAVAAPATAQTPPDVQRGRVLVKTYCAQCHSIDKVGPSPLSVAPPLRDLHLRYPVEDLEEAFAEGISTGHPSMPQFQLDPYEIHDLIAFLKSLE